MTTRYISERYDSINESSELYILNHIQKFRTVYMDRFMISITKLGDYGMVWILLCLYLYIRGNNLHLTFLLVSSLIAESVLCNLLLKPIVARTRPFRRNTAIHLLIPEPHDYSFPSGHTSASFACVTVLYLTHYILWKYALILSVLISFSRLYLYVHYPTDVLAGMSIGIISGCLVFFFI